VGRYLLFDQHVYSEAPVILSALFQVEEKLTASLESLVYLSILTATQKNNAAL